MHRDRTLVARGWGRGGEVRGLLFSGNRVSVSQNEKVLELHLIVM